MDYPLGAEIGSGKQMFVDALTESSRGSTLNSLLLLIDLLMGYGFFFYFLIINARDVSCKFYLFTCYV